MSFATNFKSKQDWISRLKAKLNNEITHVHGSKFKWNLKKLGSTILKHSKLEYSRLSKIKAATLSVKHQLVAEKVFYFKSWHSITRFLVKSWTKSIQVFLLWSCQQFFTFNKILRYQKNLVSVVHKYIVTANKIWNYSCGMKKIWCKITLPMIQMDVSRLIRVNITNYLLWNINWFTYALVKFWRIVFKTS